jgi:hypothetical protein
VPPGEFVCSCLHSTGTVKETVSIGQRALFVHATITACLHIL